MNSPLKWHGGKGPIASWIVSLMPPHLHYVEPYFGGGSVLFAKEQAGSEVANDTDGWLMNFYGVLQDPERFQRFQFLANLTPLSEPLWEEKRTDYECGRGIDDVDRALSFFVMVRQSMSGRKTEFTPLSKTRVRRGMNEQVSAWLSTVEGLEDVHSRLRTVAIRNQLAIEVILAEDGPKTLFYLDPPYLHETRATVGEYGDYEMSRAQHLQLLERAVTLKGKVMLSAYPHDMYTDALAPLGWRCHEKEVPINASHVKYRRRQRECVWTNFAA